MPELPEVETVRRELEPQLVGRVFGSAWSHPSSKFTPAMEVVGAEVVSIDRRGKYLLVATDDDTELVLHLGMTGQLLIGDEVHDAYVRAKWKLDDGLWLNFRDVRRFGRLRVVRTGDYRTIATLHTIGPEPFGEGFDGDTFYEALRSSTRRIKTQLLSQRPVAGVGNIYADEALWLAQIHPGTRALSRPRAHLLRDAIEMVIERAVDNGGTTLRDYRTPSGEKGSNQAHLRCYGRSGEPCERCGDILTHRTYDARTTTFCLSCQRR